MALVEITADYPGSLRHLADQPSTPVGVRAVLHECAEIIERLFMALHASNNDVGVDEFIVTVRASLPSMTNLKAGNAAVSVSAGSDVDPANPLLLLAAHDAIVMCAQDACDRETRTSH